MIKERNCGIDLLRLILMYMICILHVLGQGGILANSPIGSIRYSIFWLMEIFSFCAVDAFAIISGYVASNKPCKYEKLINIWFKVFFYSFIITIFFVLVGKANNIGKIDIIKNFFPITFERYWYMTSYFLLFLTMPILNKYLFKINKKTAKKIFIIIIIIFTIMGLFEDPFKTMKGYSAIWLIVLYCVGVLANKIDIFGKKKSITLIIIWLFLVFVTWYSYVHFETKLFLKYTSPTVLFCGLILVILFKRLKIKSNTIIKIASLSLGIYLFQLNQVIWENYIGSRFAFIVNKKIYIAIPYILLIALVIWFTGLVVEFIRSKLEKIIKLDLLSKKIINIIDNILVKLSNCLK